MPHSHRFALVVAVASLVLMVATSVHAGGGSCYWHSKKDRALAKKTNTARANAGIRKLSLDPHLSRVARRQAGAMAKKQALYHTPSLGSLVTRWRSLAENVGFARSVRRVHRAFMASAPHRANILKSAYRFVGVGVRKADGYVWVAVVFESRRNPGTTLKMPSC